MRGTTLAWQIAAVVGVLCALAQAGCSCGDDDGPPSRVEAVIGPAGGELTSSDGRVWLIIPPRAVDEELPFYIEESAHAAPTGAVTLPYDIGVVGQGEVELHEPATIVFFYDVERLGDRSPQALRGATSTAGIVWSCITFSAVGGDDHSLVVSTTHLSTWTARYEPCEPACTAPETCVGVGSEAYCAIPCTDDGQCPFPMSCKDIGVCAHTKCAPPAGAVCPDGTTCSMCPADTDPELGCGVSQVGVCLPHCEPGTGCGDPEGVDDGQHACSQDGHCDLSSECPDSFSCDAETCLHGSCVPSTGVGCDCADPECPCYRGGGGDIGGEWNHRYNCAVHDTRQCVDVDRCGSPFTLSPGPGPGDWTDNEGLTGHFDDETMTMTWILEEIDEGYTEVGTWEFSDDFQTFTQVSCYAYDADGTVDPDLLTCSGGSWGECTGTGARETPGPPAAVLGCAEGGPNCNPQ